MIHIAYNFEETVQDPRLKLETRTGYPAGAQQLFYDGAAVMETMPIRALAQGSAILTLSRVDAFSSKPPGQAQSKHSYRNVEAEEMAKQYLGNIGLLSRGNTFESHIYDDVKGKGEALQVLEDMASFPPRFRSRGKDKSANQC